MRTAIITFALLSVIQTIASESITARAYSHQQEAKAQASKKQAEAERLSSQFIKLFGEGKFDEALPLANRVLELSEEVFGANDVAVANAASNLAEVYLAKGNSQKAEPLLSRAIQINDKALKPTDPILVKTLERYTCVLDNREHDDKLKDFERARLPIFRATSEPDRFWGALWLVTKSTKMPRPKYPQAAVPTSKRILVEVTVNEQGKVVQAQNMCSGRSPLIDVAEQAAKQAEFEPVLTAGKPLRVIGYLVYEFIGQ
jgi:tetratricopeptide (TPR) repeat protein